MVRAQSGSAIARHAVSNMHVTTSRLTFRYCFGIGIRATRRCYTLPCGFTDSFLDLAESQIAITSRTVKPSIK